jgi:hypothetical protein
MFAAKNQQLTRPSGGYVIPRSLRFRSSASAYLNRTNVGSVTNNKIFTFSSWVKKSKLNTAMQLIGAEANYHAFGFWSSYAASDILEFSDGTGGAWRVNTTNLYRDPSGWYHIILSVDTTQATAANRVHIYVNGVECIYATATYPTQNTTISINTNSLVSNIGYRSGGSTFPFDGYLAEMNFIDGQALTPTSFGAINATTGVWAPIRYAGTYGTNGFHLDFNSYATTAALGTDTSGNGNTWTVNNCSVTAGVTYDSMIDVPTVSATGSNYCVLNPLDGLNPAYCIDGNLKYSPSTTQAIFRSTFSLPATGLYYGESTVTGTTGPAVAASMYFFTAAVPTNTTGRTATGAYGIYSTNIGYLISNGADVVTTLGVMNAGDVIQFAVNRNTGDVWFGKNNAWYNNAGGTTGNPSTGANPSISSLPATPDLFVGCNCYGNSQNFNFGQRPFTYTPPTGYSALNTYNLPTPSILIGDVHMYALTYTGNNAAARVITGLNFQPDLLWIKTRVGAYNHRLHNSVNGAAAGMLSSNTTAAEDPANPITSFNSNGFTSQNAINSTDNGAGVSATMIAWAWKGSGTTVSNTNGSITSTVCVNPTAGFSVVGYTGTGALATVGHGLGVTPSMMIIKNRTSAAAGWIIYHAYANASPATGFLQFTTGAFNADATAFNNTAPTSSVFTVNTAAYTNGATTMVNYCFAPIAGYSAFGSYTGNGSADGTFVFTGFRPRYILVKNITTAGTDWEILDTTRSPYNAVGLYLLADTAGSEVSAANRLDILSNGFKWRDTGSDINASAATYIYAAFAEFPFKNSLAR